MGGVVVIGAGGMGRDAVAWAREADPAIDLLGFVDGDPSLRDAAVDGLPVLGDEGWLAGRPDVEVVVAIGSPSVRRAVDVRVAEVAPRRRSIVHPSAHLAQGVVVEDGAIVGPHVVLSRDVRLARCSIVNFGAGLGHEDVVGPYAFVGPGAHLAGNVVVGEGAEVGIGANVVQGVAIGAWARVGAGAVVVRDVPGGVTAVGVPARPRLADLADP